MDTNIEKSFYCLGKAGGICYDCAYCRAKDTCKDKTVYDILPSEINPLFKNLPVAINLFYGDPLLQKDKTIEYLKRLEKVGHKGIVTIITKGDFSLFPDIPFDLDLHIAFSTFGRDHIYDGGNLVRFERNLEAIAKRQYNYKYSIEFRPICYGINDKEETIRYVLKQAQQYGLCVGYSGLQGKPDIVAYWEEQGYRFKPYPNTEFGHKKPLSAEVEGTIRRVAEELGVKVFNKTSCLLSYVHNKDRDYNCHYYRPDEVSCHLCPMNERCSKAKEHWHTPDLPIPYTLTYKDKHECILCKTGKCNYPTDACCKMSGIVLTTDVPLTIADYRVIKWLTGYMVDHDFDYNQSLSSFWGDC